ncbi:MAG TPA: hypothetical protein VFV15_06800 [Moraxellaceae bacterium]|nr:hypothetical protein [Moraxellaceae bacterium]
MSRDTPSPLVLALALAGALGGCTTEAWYESARVSAEQRCREQPPGAQEECLSRLNQKSYDDYRRERDATLQKAP